MTLRPRIYIPNSFEQAVTFNGTNQRASSTSSSFSITSALTFGGWMKMTTAGQAGAYIMGNSSWAIEVGSGGSRPSMTMLGNWNENPVTYGSLADLAWHHVVISYDLTNVYIYQDGLLIGKKPQTTTPQKPSKPDRRQKHIS